MRTLKHGTTRLILCTCCILLLSGCWNSRELDQLGITVAIGVDLNEQGEYELSVQLINPSEIATDAPTTRPPVSVYASTGQTLLEAFRKLTSSSPRKIYLSQVRMLIFGERLAEEGIIEALDLFYRDHEMRTEFMMVVAKGVSPRDLLGILTPFEKVPANKILHTIESSEQNWAPTKGVKIDEVLSDLLSEAKDPVMTGIEVFGPVDFGKQRENVELVDSPTKIYVDFLGVFKGDQLIGWLNQNQSKGHNYIAGSVKSTVITFPMKGDCLVSVEVLRTNTSTASKLENGKPVITIDLNMEGNIGEVHCPIDLSDPKTIEKINHLTEEDIKEKMISSIQAAQNKFESDIFGFGGILHREHPKYWKKVKDDWNTHFAELDYEINVTSNIRRKGKMVQPTAKGES
ncbi:Ger(x)C family spore germination protein [Thalassobacillus hwangdonensis]|uniref:Ger(X)C family spore germination protein n=1 Tax=Thalassobacillus hwangdonensis TaxID=546108 RepID=A0ABW3KV02_9BACI